MHPKVPVERAPGWQSRAMSKLHARGLQCRNVGPGMARLPAGSLTRRRSISTGRCYNRIRSKPTTYEQSSGMHCHKLKVQWHFCPEPAIKHSRTIMHRQVMHAEPACAACCTLGRHAHDTNKQARRQTDRQVSRSARRLRQQTEDRHRHRPRCIHT